jgi:hypothetical protein
MRLVFLAGLFLLLKLNDEIQIQPEYAARNIRAFPELPRRHILYLANA